MQLSRNSRILPIGIAWARARRVRVQDYDTIQKRRSRWNGKLLQRGYTTRNNFKFLAMLLAIIAALGRSAYAQPASDYLQVCRWDVIINESGFESLDAVDTKTIDLPPAKSTKVQFTKPTISEPPSTPSPPQAVLKAPTK